MKVEDAANPKYMATAVGEHPLGLAMGPN